MFCQNSTPTGLNFYSKNNLVREKRNITSLYSLISTSPEHTKTIVENFSFRIPLPRQNGQHRNQSFKQLNASSSLKYFHLSGMHEYEQINILKEAHMDTLSRNHSAKSIVSRYSFNQLESWKRRAMKNSCREEEDHHQSLGLQQNESQSEDLEELAESVFRDGEMPEEMKAESVVIDKVGLSSVQKITNPEFFSHQYTPFSYADSYAQAHTQQQPKPQQSSPQVLISLEPLQHQPYSSIHTVNPIHSAILQNPSQVQIPDKLSMVQAEMEYDQKDFYDLVDSPIELIKEDTNRHQSSEFGFDKNMEEELKEMLRQNNTDRNVNIQLEQKHIITQQYGKAENLVKVEQFLPPKPKKMNFKAMMSKHKKLESQEQKQEKKKRLLSNFFDEN